MKLLINWDDNIAIIDGLEYKIKFYNSVYEGRNFTSYIRTFVKSTFYRKDDLILEKVCDQYYLIKLDKNDKISHFGRLHEITD